MELIRKLLMDSLSNLTLERRTLYSLRVCLDCGIGIKYIIITLIPILLELELITISMLIVRRNSKVEYRITIMYPNSNSIVFID